MKMNSFNSMMKKTIRQIVLFLGSIINVRVFLVVFGQCSKDSITLIEFEALLEFPLLKANFVLDTVLELVAGLLSNHSPMLRIKRQISCNISLLNRYWNLAY